MKILFVDESGDPGNPNIHPAATKFLIVGGTILSERNWLRLRDGVVALKRQYKISSECELKWAHLRSPRKGISLEHLDFEKRRVFAKDFLNLVKKVRGAKIILVIIDKGKLYKKRQIGFSTINLYAEAYSVLLERFEYYLEDKNDLGLVIHDFTSNFDETEKMRRVGRKIIKNGTRWAKMTNLFETFLFVPSDQSIGVQTADFIVGAVSRWQNAKDEQYLKIIKDKFLRNKRGKIEGAGLKFFP